MRYRYYISQAGADLLDEASESYAIRNAKGDLSNLFLVLGVLNSEYTYSGERGKTARGLRDELFAGSDVGWLERVLEALVKDGYVEKYISDNDEDRAIKHQQYPYKTWSDVDNAPSIIEGANRAKFKKTFGAYNR